MKGIYTVEDAVGKTFRCSVNGVTDKAALATLVAALDPLTNGAITEYHVLDGSSFAGTKDATGQFQSGENKLNLIFRYYDGVDKMSMRLAIPAPADTEVSHVTKTGWRAIQAKGEAVAALLSTATGRTLSFVSGKVSGKPTQAQQ
jgi:hypothetical protein